MYKGIAPFEKSTFDFKDIEVRGPKTDPPNTCCDNKTGNPNNINLPGDFILISDNLKYELDPTLCEKDDNIIVIETTDDGVKHKITMILIKSPNYAFIIIFIIVFICIAFFGLYKCIKKDGFGISCNSLRNCFSSCLLKMKTEIGRAHV